MLYFLVASSQNPVLSLNKFLEGYEKLKRIRFSYFLEKFSPDDDNIDWICWDCAPKVAKEKPSFTETKKQEDIGEACVDVCYSEQKIESVKAGNTLLVGKHPKDLAQSRGKSSMQDPKSPQSLTEIAKQQEMRKPRRRFVVLDDDSDFEREGGASGGKFSSLSPDEHYVPLNNLYSEPFRVPIGQWHCPHCSGDQHRTIKSFSQKKIVDFFRIQKESQMVVKCTSSQDIRKRRKRPLVFHKRRRRLFPFTPTEDPDRRLVQMASLASALTALDMEFSDELTYMPSMAPKSANSAKFESGGMQVLSKEDTETLEQCRAMYKRGECPPLMVVFDSHEGYTVEADGPIKDLTIIAEYTGDVDYIRNRQEDDCDSMMTLLLARDPLRSLVICPDKRGNISRFINGINNHSPEGKKKQNLKCVRYSVNGACRVILVAGRDIAKGERLYYDYNGYEHEYPTHHFI
ncbi:hypothetical protein K7X08_021573 [Anisodus acutangulus]|uniref:[histone H3]-lysine(27) N-methyltransferase n=1 Tax=Anisodus acutangulus TaxID=402998 RepID=A0A9Q1RBD5_9SOLA|nr:hypothetical protein K7X08_021573 [Anisodus acutangulus]